MDNRQPIPTALKRKVLVEAGHRCAIPTCRQTPVEIAHIVPWAICQKHEFDNLIALCPTCHTRYDKGEIDRKSMQAYKHNLSVLNSRYGDLEKRVLLHFARNPSDKQITLPILNGATDIFLMYLIQDQMIIALPEQRPILMSASGRVTMPYELTNKGREFIDKWLSAEAIEEMEE